RRCRTAAASRCAVAGDRPRTAPTGSGTRARTGSAPGRASPRAGSCPGFLGLADRRQRRLHCLGVDAVAEEQVLARGVEAVALERRQALAGVARRLVSVAQQQHPLAFHQLEVEAAVGLAVLLEHREHGPGALARRVAGGPVAAEVAQADGLAQRAEERRGMAFAQLAGTLAQLFLDALRMRDERVVAFAQRRHFRFDAVEQLLLGIAPA